MRVALTLDFRKKKSPVVENQTPTSREAYVVSNVLDKPQYLQYAYHD
jgi:hypothetical protein